MSFAGKKLGQEGEDRALEYLLKKGYRFVGRNIRLFCGEIDLLFEDKGVLAIVEVKTKTSSRYSTPQEKIDRAKKRKLLQLARALWQKFPDKTIRIDVIAIDEERDLLDHIINAVEEE